MKKNDFHRLHVSLLIIFVCLLKGHQGFFIKHSVSGLCLKVNDASFAAKLKDWGANYYVRFYDECLHTNAQYHYVEGKFVHNIAKVGHFFGREGRYNNRFIVYRYTSRTAAFVRGNDFALRHESGTLEIYDGKYCATPSKSSKPFNGTYPVKTTTCDQDLQRFTFGSVTDKVAIMADVNCASSQVMEVVMAEYGVFRNGGTFKSSTDAACSLPVGCIVKGLCDGKISCGITVDNRFTFNQCAGTKRLHMEYQCVDSLGTPITSVSDVRLSKEVLLNEGFVEVFNGTIWKKLSDESWDKRKQAALCRHLGYIDGENDTVVKNTSPGEMILSGDLYCQGTKPSNQSCCAYLYPSTSTAVSNMAYAKCM